MTNDVSWYKNYPTLTKDVASLFMSRPNGVDYPMVPYGSDPSIHAFTNGPTDYYLHQGGFLRFNILPTFGACGQFNIPSSPLNTAASKLYYYVVHGNSRNISYDKSDLMKCYMAYDSVIMVLEEAKRAYKFIKAQSVSNKWVRNIVTGLGWNYDDLTQNIVRFRQIINLAAIKLNQISIPNVFPIFDCHRELFQYVYVDRASGKPQFMANVSSAAWIYSDEFSELEAFGQGTLPGHIIATNWNPGYSSPRTVDDFQRLINWMIDSLYNSTDIGVIQGDLKRAFDQGQMIDVQLLQEDEELPIMPSLEYNLCMHNAEIFNYMSYATVTQPVTGETRNVLSVIRDRRVMDGNMEFGIFTNTNVQSPNTGDWHPFGDVHMMDLIDEWNEDQDAIILMQKFKWNMSYASGFYVHAQATETAQHVAAVPESIGPAIIQHVCYFYDPENSAHYIPVTRIMDVDSSSASLADQVAGIVKLYELGVTLQVIARFKSGSTTKALPITWEVENVTVYDNKVLWNIQNSMIESLWYNSALYNLG